ncbi:hypothetical protein WP50_30205 [Lactiplantibacillus plantarum]|nr:hypothetical protein WP50_30205 [Lactiplantibacillus plantarum]
MLVMGVNAPLFDQCLQATNDNFHLLPIVSADDLDNQHVQDIINGKSKLSSLVVTDRDYTHVTLTQRKRVYDFTVMPAAEDRA